IYAERNDAPGRCASAHTPARRVAGGLRSHRDEGRVRRRRVRRLHGPRRRRAGELVPGPARARRARARHDDRRTRRPPPAAARVRGTRRRAVRHLHARHDHGGHRARKASRPRGDPDRPRGQLVSMHRLRGDLPIGAPFAAWQKAQTPTTGDVAKSAGKATAENAETAEFLVNHAVEAMAFDLPLPVAMNEPLNKDRLNAITDHIIGAAVAVRRALGPGLLESAYEACLGYELKKRGLAIEQQKPL